MKPHSPSSRSDRPRERLLHLGPSSLSDAELLALLLSTGTRGHDSLSISRSLLAHFSGDLRRLAHAGTAELAAFPGVGLAKAARVHAALALAGRLDERPIQRGEPLASAADVYRRIGWPLRLLEREVFVAVALDVKNRVLCQRRVAEGGICAVSVAPRDLFLTCIREGAAGVIFVHNHPSGEPAPSLADIEFTERLEHAGELLGIPVLDHVIVAQRGYYSFRNPSSHSPQPPAFASPSASAADFSGRTPSPE